MDVTHVSEERQTAQARFGEMVKSGASETELFQMLEEYLTSPLLLKKIEDLTDGLGSGPKTVMNPGLPSL
jgi:hypothetical protein